ncbi:MAG: hypothetical protein RDV41_02870 [Planctomycetota bacterium]|nr:hypothetical protein [Planctomycetota bacterium]
MSRAISASHGRTLSGRLFGPFAVAVLALALAAPVMASTPYNVQITDVKDTQFVITWNTTAAEAGSIRYRLTAGPGAWSGAVAQDGGCANGTHRVQIAAVLVANTAYQIEITSGGTVYDNGGAYWGQTTSTLADAVGLPVDMISGHLHDAGANYDGAIVYLRIRDSGNGGTAGNSQWKTVLSNGADAGQNFIFVIGDDLSTYWDFRQTNLTAFFQYSAGDFVDVYVQGGTRGRTAVQTYTMTTGAETAWPHVGAIDLNAILLDHFTFDAFGNQSSGTAFSITVRGRNGDNTANITYTGAITLSDFTGSIAPTAFNLVTGVGTSNVTITTAGYSNDRISYSHVGDPFNNTGFSDPFNVAGPLNHFHFAAIGSPQPPTPGQFAITITGHDAGERTRTDYVGTPALTANGDGGAHTVTPNTSPAFVAGVGGPFNVAIGLPADTNVIITATDAAITGNSNAFNVQFTVATWDGSADTNWANPANWNTDPNFPNSAAYNVTIPALMPNYPVLGAGYTIYNLTVNADVPAPCELDLNNNTLTVSGAATIDALAQVNFGNANGKMDVAGNVTNNGILNFQNGANSELELDGALSAVGTLQNGGTVVFASTTGAQNVPAGNYTGVEIDKNGQVATATGIVNAAGGLTVTNGTFNLGAGPFTHVIAGAVNVAATGTLTANNNTLQIGGNFVRTGTFNPDTGTVVFNGGGAQAVPGGTYNHFQINKGGGVATAGAALDIAGNVTITTAGGASFAPGAFTHTVAGTWDDSASAGGFAPGAGTFTFDAAPGGATTYAITMNAANNFWHVIFNGNANATFRPASILDVNGDLTVSGGTFDHSAAGNVYVHEVAGNFLKNGGVLSMHDDAGDQFDIAGSFTVNAGTVSLLGGGDILVAGAVNISADNTFVVAAADDNDFFMDGGGAQALTFTGANNTFGWLQIDQAGTQVTAASNVAARMCLVGGGGQYSPGAFTTTVLGDFNVNAGCTLFMNNAASTLTVGNFSFVNNAISTISNGTINCSGTFEDNTDGSVPDYFRMTGGTLNLNGAGAQTLTIGTGAGANNSRFYNLTLGAGNRTVGVTAVGGDLTVLNNLTLGNQVILDVNTNAATVGGTFQTNAGGSNRPTITSTGAGATFGVGGTGIMDVDGLIMNCTNFANGLQVTANTVTMTQLDNVQFTNHPGGGGRFLDLNAFTTGLAGGNFSFWSCEFGAIAAGDNVVTGAAGAATVINFINYSGAGAGDAEEIEGANVTINWLILNNWEGDVSALWNVAGNWSQNAVPTAAHVARIGFAPNNNPPFGWPTVNVGGPTTVGTLQIDTAGQLNLGIAGNELIVNGDVQNAGTVNFQNGELTVNGACTNTGTFAWGVGDAGLLSLRGAFTAGTVTANGGTVAFESTTANQTVPATVTYFNLEIANGLGRTASTAGTFTVANNFEMDDACAGTFNVLAGHTMNVTGNALVEGGTFDLDGNLNVGGNLTVQNGVLPNAFFVCDNASQLTVTGSMTLAAGTFTCNNGSVTIGGTSTLNSVPAFWNLTLGPGAVVTANANIVDVNGNMTLNGSLTLSGAAALDLEGSLALNGTLALNGAGLGHDIAGALTNAGTLSIANNDKLTLSGGAVAHTNTGTINLGSGELEITNTFTNNGTINFQTAGVLDANAAFTNGATGTLNFGSAGGNTGTFEIGAGFTQSGTINEGVGSLFNFNGATAVNMPGDGFVDLSVTGGATVSINSGTATTFADDVLVNAGSTLRFLTGTFAVAGDLDVDQGTLTVNSTASTLTVTGRLRMGNTAASTLNIGDQADVTVGNGTSLLNNSILNLGGSSGSLTNTGPLGPGVAFNAAAGTANITDNGTLYMGNNTIANILVLNTAGNPTITSTNPGTDRFEFNISAGGTVNVDALNFGSATAPGFNIAANATLTDLDNANFANAFNTGPNGTHLTLLRNEGGAVTFYSMGCSFDASYGPTGFVLTGNNAGVGLVTVYVLGATGAGVGTATSETGPIDFLWTAAATTQSQATGNWTAGGTWTAGVPSNILNAQVLNTHTVTVDAAGQQVVDLTVNVGGTLTVGAGNTLTVFGSMDNNGTVNVDGTLTVNGNLTGEGVWNLNAGGALTIQGDTTVEALATMTINATGTLTFQGDFTNNGTVVNNNDFTFTGSQSVNVNFGANCTLGDDLIVNMGAGGAAVTLVGSNVVVGDDVTVTNGILDLGGLNMTLNSNGAVLTVAAGGTLRLNGNSVLGIANAGLGTLTVNGTLYARATGTPTITSANPNTSTTETPSAGAIYIAVGLNGIVDVNGLIYQSVNAAGVDVQAAATLTNFDNVALACFENNGVLAVSGGPLNGDPAPAPATNKGLHFTNGATMNDIALTGWSFDGSLDINVHNQDNDVPTFDLWSGTRAGEAYDWDNGDVLWGAQAAGAGGGAGGGGSSGGGGICLVGSSSQMTQTIPTVAAAMLLLALLSVVGVRRRRRE